MFGIGYITKKIEPCTKARFYEAVQSSVVRDTCALIVRLEQRMADATNMKDRKWCTDSISRAKRNLPCITPMAWFKDNHRNVKNAVPSGLNMLDVDHVEDPRGLWSLTSSLHKGEGDKPLTIGGYEVVLVHVTPSTHGLRVIFKQPDGKSIEEAQADMARAMNVEYDGVTKDLARCSFLVPFEYILYMDEERLFGLTPALSQGEGDINSTESTNSKNNEQDKKQNGNTGDAPSSDGSKTAEESINTPLPTGEGLGGAVGRNEAFKSIPYSEIIKAILFSAGYDDTPAEGERNNALYMLARNLRYVCDFDVEHILSIVPGWGLPEQEMRTTVESAVKSVRKVVMPRQLQSIVDALQKQYGKLSDQGYSEVWDYVVQADGIIGDIVNMQPRYLQNACYLACMTCFGTLMTRLRGYGCDGSVIAPNFMLAISAPQATGKSFMKHVFELVCKPIIDHDKQMRSELNEIERENKRHAADDSYEQKDFEGDIRLLSSNTSNRILVERMDKAQGQHLMIVAEEIDSITKAEKAGKWSEKSDIYRLAYDNSVWGQDYANENSYHAMVELYLNLLFSGTPAAVSRFFNDIENGLITRFLFCDLPDTYGMKRPKKKRMDAAKKQWLDNQMAQIYETMNANHGEDGTIWVDTTQMVDDVERLYDEPQRIAYLCNQMDPSRDLARRRYADYGVKMMMIETYLNNGVYTDSIRDRVINTLNYCTEQLLALHGDAINQSLNESVEKHEIAKARSTKQNILDMVETEFTTKEYAEAVVAAGGSANTASPYLQRLVTGGLIELVSRGIYRKIM